VPNSAAEQSRRFPILTRFFGEPYLSGESALSITNVNAIDRRGELQTGAYWAARRSWHYWSGERAGEQSWKVVFAPLSRQLVQSDTAVAQTQVLERQVHALTAELAQTHKIHRDLLDRFVTQCEEYERLYRVVRDDLARAGITSSDPALLAATASDFIARENLGNAVAVVEALVGAAFGEQASVTPQLEMDRQTGEQNLVLAIRYGLPPETGLESVRDRHRKLLDDFVREVPSAAQAKITILRYAR
jgi:hypothetical protein